MKRKEICIDSMEALGQTADEVYEYLNRISQFQRTIKLLDKEVDAEILLKYHEYLLLIIKNQMKKNQREGIKRKLEKKAKGCGEYGRPKKVLPDDFAEQVKNRYSHNKPLLQYCREIKMKQSTFYRYAKEIIENEKKEKNKEVSINTHFVVKR